MKHCSNCGITVFFKIQKEDKFFCSNKCLSFYYNPKFCQNCISTTSDKSAGKTTTINGFGTGLFFEKNICPICESVVQIKFIFLFFAPIIPLGKYRVKWINKTQYYSRKLKKK